MKRGQRGVTLIELQVAITIGALIAIAATISTIQLMKYSSSVTDRMTAIRHVENAGYWIARDAETAGNVTVDGLTFPNFMVMTWTVYGYDGAPSVHHSVTYAFADFSQGVGKLKRTHWSSGGANETTLISEYIYYDVADPSNTSKASYQSSELAVTLTGRYGSATRSKVYTIVRRANFF